MEEYLSTKFITFMKKENVTQVTAEEEERYSNINSQN
jgi:hypothetical protein